MKQKSYKIRVYPTRLQKEYFAKSEGATRYVRNRVLSEMDHYHQETGGYKSIIEMSREVTKWKKAEETSWLKEIPDDVLRQELRDLDAAFKNFFAKRSNYPKKKKKTFGCSIRFVFDQRHLSKVRNWLQGNVILPKFGKLKLGQKNRLPVEMPKQITMSRDCADRYFISFMVEQEIQELPKTGNQVGVDLGIKTLVYCSDGKKYDGARSLRRKLKHLKRLQRSLSRKVKGSNRYKKQRLKVGKLHRKIADTRNHRLHEITTDIVRNNDNICLEDLNVKGMVKNHNLALSLSDCSFGEIRRQLVYKSNWYGREILLSNVWNPTSKMCSGCGQIHEMKLSDRIMLCDCGLELDRDFNAAINILNFSLKENTVENTGIYARGAVNNPNLFESNSGTIRTAMEPIGSEKREPNRILI
jgi:putative transposase